jgi:2-methylcitrate dehydratase PrpD
MVTGQSNGEVTARLSRFVAACRWRDLSEPVRREAKRSLVNFFATSFAGCHEPPVEKAVHLLRRSPPAPPRPSWAEANVWMSSTRPS